MPLHISPSIHWLLGSVAKPVAIPDDEAIVHRIGGGIRLLLRSKEQKLIPIQLLRVSLLIHQIILVIRGRHVPEVSWIRIKHFLGWSNDIRWIEIALWRCIVAACVNVSGQGRAMRVSSSPSATARVMTGWTVTSERGRRRPRSRTFMAASFRSRICYPSGRVFPLLKPKPLHGAPLLLCYNNFFSVSDSTKNALLTTFSYKHLNFFLFLRFTWESPTDSLLCPPSFHTLHCGQTIKSLSNFIRIVECTNWSGHSWTNIAALSRTIREWLAMSRARLQWNRNLIKNQNHQRRLLLPQHTLCSLLPCWYWLNGLAQLSSVYWCSASTTTARHNVCSDPQ